MTRRSNAGFFERLRGPRSTSYRGELQRRRHEAKLEAVRRREAEREEIRRERQKVRDANKLKRQLLVEERREEQKRRKEEEREAPHKAMPSASAIERAYQRGAKTLSEAMEMARGNPGSRNRVYRIVPASGGEESEPDYFMAFEHGRNLANHFNEPVKIYQEDRDTGKRRLLKTLRPTKYNPRGTKGRFERCVKAVSERGGAYDPRAVCGAQEKKYRGNPDDAPIAYVGAQRKDGKHPVQLVYPTSGKRLSKLMTAEQIDQLRAKGYNVYGSARNPADAAIAVSEEFHGRKVKAMIPVQQKRHYHKYLAELGELRKLVVLCRDGKHRVTLSKFDGAILAANEDKNQLFIVGGDQSVNLNDFGVKNPHETETLGEVITIDYFTDKEHLGDEGGVAVYTHKFRSTNENGKHKTVRMAEYPDLIYHLRDEHLEFSGGSYEIRAEGIDL